MRAVSSGTGGTGCDRRSDMDDLRTRKPSNARAAHKAADFANGVPALLEHHKALGGIRAFYDLQSGPRGPAHRPGRFPALVSAIRDHPLQEGKEPPHRPQDIQAAIPI